ncbi:hypothetical protein MUK42_37170 [Musa troglodytarum]|uniref:Uncharacterized protein n=1 Tax=Musa troglodytarum TaxID=320322 RepID=A0A9E7FKG6_9LILI|nr:hypothetical protein MUK42_37170 [Musa troglodytarum]
MTRLKSEVNGSAESGIQKAEDVDTAYALPLLVPKLLHSSRKWYFGSINEKAQEIDQKFQVSDKTKSAFSQNLQCQRTGVTGSKENGKSKNEQ